MTRIQDRSRICTTQWDWKDQKGNREDSAVRDDLNIKKNNNTINTK